jgi:hypothetical protein
MNNLIRITLTFSLTAMAFLLPGVAAQAEIHSKSKDLVVLEPRDLPKQAQLKGDALLLHENNEGVTLLYIEQLEGTQLSVFDVTDPSRMKLVVSTELPHHEPFDFVRPLGDNAELVYFPSERKLGVLDLRHARQPSLHAINASSDLATAERLDESSLLATNTAYNLAPQDVDDLQIVDISSEEPKVLVTIKGVNQRVTNHETGTIFLLGSEGLTVIRSLTIENDYKAQEMQMRGN